MSKSDEIPAVSNGIRRAALGRAIIEMMRAMRDAYGVTDNLGGFGLDFVLGMAIMSGQGIGKPLSVTDIANYTGTPRATVWRQLRRHEKAGTVKFVRIRNRQVVLLSLASDDLLVKRIAEITKRFVRQVTDPST